MSKEIESPQAEAQTPEPPTRRRGRKPGTRNRVDPPRPRVTARVWVVWHVENGHVELIGATRDKEEALMWLEDEPEARVTSTSVLERPECSS